MDWHYETKYRARADVLAALAIDRCAPEKLGQIIEVSGGQFRGDQTVYLSPEMILRSMGQMKDNKP